jgi:succinoglycan biosynthesis transport protein ExoP
MLQIDKGSLTSVDPALDLNGSSLSDALASLTGVLRRQRPVLLFFLVCATLIGLAYCFTTPPSYTARATMVIDTRKVQAFQQQSTLGDLTIDAGAVQTQVEVLKSQNISLAVIKQQNLIDDPEFTGRGTGLFGAVADTIDNLFNAKDNRSEAELTRRALSAFEARRMVDRVGITYVMEISFLSLDPNKAARIANAIVDAYIVDQLEAKYQATQRASNWLQARIGELRTQASSADKAVVDFKDKNNILNTGGRLMNEQQLSEINSQLVLAHASTTEARARYEQIQEVMKQAVPDGSMADALKSEVIIKLRGQYLDLAGREAIWSNKYGANHQATINLRNQMQELRHNIADEMQKIAESYKNDLQIAEAREQSITNSLAGAVSASQMTNQAQVQLRELESNSQSYRSMYDNFLQRYMESVQQQSFPISEARLISPATRPLKKSEPNIPLVMSVTMLCGMLGGFGVALFRELSDRVFRSGKQVEDILQVNCLATLPKVKSAAPPASAVDMPGHMADSGQVFMPSIYRHVVEVPFSQFAEGLRSVKVALDLHGLLKSNKVVGITSTVPNEGKSTIATNFAAMIAHSGARVLLIDADLRNPSLSGALTPLLTEGLVDVIGNKIPSASAIWTENTTGLSFMPAGSTSKLLHTNEILRSPSLKTLIDQLRTAYDYIIIDLPPLAPVVDARTTTSFVDSYLYIVEWGATKIEMVEHGLAEAREVYERLLGVVLNKADPTTLARYEYYRGNSYYKKSYKRYGYVD